MEKRKNIPELRFPGFEGEWENCQLSKVATFLNGRAYSKSELLSKGKYPVLRVGNFVSNLEWYFSDLELENEKFAFSGDLLYAWSASFGPRIWYGEQVIYHYHIWKIIVKKHISKLFLYNVLLIQTDVVKRRMANGLGLLHITKGEIEKWSVPIPSLPEQEKIAGFLSAVDKRIELLRRKKELTELYKKGVMQKIFSREIRFRNENGNPFPEWEEKKLGEVSEKCREKNSKNKYSLVLTNSATKGIISQTEYFEKSIANNENIQTYYIVMIDEFVYNPRISSSAPCGPINRNKFKNGIMSPLYMIFRIKKGILPYFDYFFKTDYWNHSLYRIANFGARFDRMNIQDKDFFNIRIFFPSLPEQKKIAEFLQAIDKRIELLAKEIEKTELFKKGLLQKMFV